MIFSGKQKEEVVVRKRNSYEKIQEFIIDDMNERSR